MKRKMPETEYRASQVCRILGNPTAYQVIKSLFNDKKSPTELSKEIRVSVITISDVLCNLRNIDLVRYEVRANTHIYWLKDPMLKATIEAIEHLLKNSEWKNGNFEAFIYYANWYNR